MRLYATKNLRRKRLEQGISVTRIAHDLGISRQYIYKIEGNFGSASADKARAIAEYLGCEVTDIFEVRDKVKS